MIELQSLKKAYSHMTYDDFCEQCDFVPSQYALDKFSAFKQGIESLNNFDDDLLEGIAKRYSWL